MISDQPYFGIYNLFKNEVEDIYPGCVGQDTKKKEKQFIEAEKRVHSSVLEKNYDKDGYAIFRYDGEVYTGLSIDFYDDGQLRTVASYKDGRYDGWTKVWSEYGVMIYDAYYEIGKKMNDTYY